MAKRPIDMVQIHSSYIAFRLLVLDRYDTRAAALLALLFLSMQL